MNSHVKLLRIKFSYFVIPILSNNAYGSGMFHLMMAENPIEISEEAAKEIQNIFENKQIPSGYSLRVTVKGGAGCAGVKLTLGFDKPKEDDLTLEVQNIPVLIRKRELMYIMGKKVDFYNEADARGFLFVDQ